MYINLPCDYTDNLFKAGKMSYQLFAVTNIETNVESRTGQGLSKGLQIISRKIIIYMYNNSIIINTALLTSTSGIRK